MLKLTRWRKGLLISAGIAIAIFALARVYYRTTDDIRLSNMMYEMPYHKEWDIQPLSSIEQERVDKILDQPFSYIGKGAQAYAFGSEDGLYVLKFFKFKHLKPSLFLQALPPIGPIKTYKETQIARKQKKLEGVFEGYRLAYEVHRKPSGILFIHLNPSENLHKTVILKDKIGFHHAVDLDKFVFILQERGVTTREVLRKLLNQGDIEGAKKKIDSIIDLYVLEYSKGIYDRDHGVMHNTGFVGERPIHLDVGKLSEEPAMKNPKVSNPDLEKIAHKLHSWVHENYPQYAVQIDQEIQKKLSEVFGYPWVFKSN